MSMEMTHLTSLQPITTVCTTRLIITRLYFVWNRLYSEAWKSRNDISGIKNGSRWGIIQQDEYVNIVYFYTNKIIFDGLPGDEDSFVDLDGELGGPVRAPDGPRKIIDCYLL